MNLTASKLLEDLYSSFQISKDSKPTSAKTPAVVKKREILKTNAQKQKLLKQVQTDDNPLSADMIEELKRLREQQKSSSQQTYVSYAKSIK